MTDPDLVEAIANSWLPDELRFNDYQKAMRAMAAYPPIVVDGSEGPVEARWIYSCLGLAGETGELIDKLKKIARNQGGVIKPEDVEPLKKELGDVLWYLADLAHNLNMSLGDVAIANVQKLRDRKARGVLKSEGDNR